MSEHALRRWRKKTGTRLVPLGGQVGVSASHLSEIERGHNKPSLELTARLMEVTGLAMRDFLPQREAGR